LKNAYRDRLRAAYPDATFVLLSPGEAVLRKRIRARKGHFMPPSLLSSQLRTLEKPDASERALTIKGKIEIEEACLQVLTWLAAPGMPGAPLPEIVAAR
jgi:carbohydrate kinase (thermoresistant glucokinase family)